MNNAADATTPPVRHMVCPSCARVLGQEHVEGCPETDGMAFSFDYREGWLAARDGLVGPLVIALEATRRKWDEAHRAIRAGAAISEVYFSALREIEGR